MTKFLNISTDSTLAGNSDETVVSEKAIKAYADTKLKSGDNVSELVNDAGYLVMGDLTGFVTRTTAQTISGLKTFTADIVLSGTTSIKNTTSGVSYTMLYRDTSGIHVGTSTQALLLAGSGTRPTFNGNNVAMSADIPTVNNPTITITQGGVTKGSFTLNQATGDTIALDAGGGSSYTAGTGIDITNDVISVTAPTLTNTATGTGALGILSEMASGFRGVAIGTNANARSERSIGIGYAAGTGTSTTSARAIAIGAAAKAQAIGAIQLGVVDNTGATNSDANTFKVANANGNFEIMSADGTIPEARLADTTNAQQGDVLTLDSTGNAVWQAGGGGGGLPDQTGHAGEFLTTDGTDASWSGAIGYHPDLFDWKWADHQLNDVSWLRADTFSWQSGAVYQAAYQHLADDIDGKTLQSETIGGTTIQFYLADDGHKICPVSEESNVAAIYTATGVAWYYIIDTTNQRFKLPRTTPLTGAVKGNGTTLGLTNGTNNYGLKVSVAASNQALGVTTDAYGQPAGTASAQGGFDLYATLGVTTDATKSGIVVERAASSQFKYLYFYVGNFTQTALENTAGLNTELFNEKADVSTVAHVVTEFQEPTAANNYTWYRKYVDGWVEQGGYCKDNPNMVANISFPVPMSDTNYTATGLMDILSDAGTYVYFQLTVYARNTTGISIVHRGGSTGVLHNFGWQVSGMAAQ